MPKFKIGLVLDTSLDPVDGVQQYVVAIGEWLRGQGHDVHYLVGETKERQLANIHSLSRNIGVSFNGNKTTIPLPTSRAKLRDFMERQQFDILHVQTPHHPLLAQRLVLAADAQTAVVGTFHILPYNTLAKIGTKLLGVWLKPSLRRFDAMVAVSRTAAEFERQYFGLPAEVLPNVIDYKRFHNAKPFKKYDDDKKTILFLGRLVERKGCLTLLQAVAQLRSRTDVPPFRVVICGKGHLEANLKAYAAEHALSDMVEFTGFVSEEDKPQYFASADISVFPSSAGESFGIVLLEAMASGNAAVLAGDNPGYRTVMETQEKLLFAPHDSRALSDMLANLLQNETEHEQYADWGRTYTRNFDVAVVGRSLVRLYEKVHATRQNMQ